MIARLVKTAKRMQTVRRASQMVNVQVYQSIDLNIPVSHGFCAFLQARFSGSKATDRERCVTSTWSASCSAGQWGQGIGRDAALGSPCPPPRSLNLFKYALMIYDRKITSFPHSPVLTCDPAAEAMRLTQQLSRSPDRKAIP